MARGHSSSAMRGGRFAVPFLLSVVLAAGMAGQNDPEDWASSPEAYFLTSEERAEWKALDSGRARDRFKERYWLKRDPSPGTEKNEFHELVSGRIKVADARFPIAKTPGSRTQRGMVFIVFGAPARVQELTPRGLEAPRPATLGTIGSPVGFTEGTESTSVWTYDRERTPRILEALDNLPSLVVTFVVEPNKRRDDIQSPGYVLQYREVLAGKSVVNPDLIASSAPVSVPAPVLALPRAALSAEVLASLDAASASSRGADGSVFGSAVLWRTKEPQTFIWFYLPEPEEQLQLHGRVRTQEGVEVAVFSEAAVTSASFSTSQPKGQVIVRRIALPPGTYSAAFAVEGKRTRNAASTTLQVPDVSGGLAVSSLVLSAGAGQAGPGVSEGFFFGNALVPPRADASFLRSESLWSFLEMAGPTDPSKVTLETRLRRGGEQVGAAGPFPAGLVEIAPGRHVCGFEVPLSSMSAGDYVLYVTVRDGSRSTLRRGDFSIRDSGTSR